MVIVSFLFKTYRIIFSPMIQTVFQIQCRFEESCSHFTERKIKELGFLKGSTKGLVRFMKCNPYSKADYKAEA